MKFLLSILAGLLLLSGCGTLADKVDPAVKKGNLVPGTLDVQQTNSGGGGC